MKRRNWVSLSIVVLVLAAVLAPAMAQEPARSRTLAERLNSLRFGWRTSAPEAAAIDATPAPEAFPVEEPAPVSRPAAPPRVGVATPPRGRSVPRLNPRDLLPSQFQGVTAGVARTPEQTVNTPDVTKKQADTGRLAVLNAPGSVRARILRDLRQQGLTPAAEDDTSAMASSPEKAPAAQARVGSVLSKQDVASEDSLAASTTDADEAGQLRNRVRPRAVSSDFQRQSTVSSKGPASSTRRTSVGKSIAAEVAARMATAQVEEPSAETTDAAESIIDQAVVDQTPSIDADAESQAVVAAPTNVAAPSSSEEAGATQATAAVGPSGPIVTVENTAKEPPRVIVPVPPRAEPVAQAVEPVLEADAPATEAPKRIALETGQAIPSTSRDSTPVVTIDSAASLVTDQAAMKSSFGEARGVAAMPEDTPQVADTPYGNGVLITQAAPQVSARVLGPKQVVIGREAKFQVKVTNRGAAAARDLETRITVPEWAEVASVATTSGRLNSPTMSDAGRILWQIDRFAAGGEETMNLALVARSGRPVELAVDWTHAPVSSRALVEVQEPKLKMHIAGPDEVYFGKAQLFRLTLSNPGTGVAEDVSLLLTPPGKPIEEATRHALGDLRAGATKSVELELTAREAGKLALVAQATAAGGVADDVEKQVFCRKPEIEVDWRGPERKYTNAPSTYYFRVRNPGTAVAESVVFNVALPRGFEMTSASDGQSYNRRTRTLSWRVGSLRPGDDYYMELKGVSQTAGIKNFKVAATTGDGLISDALSAATEVVAVADLKLDVQDPKGPLPIGADAVYEVRVTNRGSNVAESVEVVALFSGGIEPQSVEGHHGNFSDGRVTLPTIERLAAGDEVVMRIHARAIEPGTHIFRAEVACRALEIRLAAEEMTRFYNDDTGLPGAARSAAADRFNSPR